MSTLIFVVLAGIVQTTDGLAAILSLPSGYLR